MKPLTIEELKAFPAGDWVWIIDKHVDAYTGYYIIVDVDYKTAIFTQNDRDKIYLVQHYGKTWLAYKNKEEAQNIIKQLRGEK